MTIGASALFSASAQASRAASRVIEASHETAKQDVDAQAPAGMERPQPPARGLETLNLIGGMVDLMRAEHAYKAGAAVIRTGDEMMEETLHLI